MYCKNCGKTLNPGELFCANCGTKVENETNIKTENNVIQNNQTETFSNVNTLNNNGNQNQEIGQTFNQTSFDNQVQTNDNNLVGMPNPNIMQVNNMNQTSIPQQPQKPKKNNLIKILAAIGGVVAGYVIVSLVMFFVTSADSEKLVCKSKEGNITIRYNEKGITNYTASGISYDLDKQKERAEEVGMDTYINEFNDWFESNTSGSCTVDGEEVSNNNEFEEDDSDDDDDQDGKRVGSDEFGYITIPKNWANFIDVNSNGTLQYSYANIYVATIYAVPTTQIDAYNYANNIMTKLESDGVQNVQGATVNVGKYTAYQVYGYYSDLNRWLVCWCFEAEDGKTHYIAIEGPDRNSEYFNIPNSFSLNK